MSAPLMRPQPAPGPLATTCGHLHRFEMARDSDGQFVGSLTDQYGWVVTIRAAVTTDSQGRKSFAGYGWITAGPPEAGTIGPRKPEQEGTQNAAG